MPRITRKPVHERLSFGLLQTCRQIYHEAVLKPLSVNTFHYHCHAHYFPGSALQNLLKALVPTQARAIKHLRLVSDNASFPRHTIMQQLKGLERLDIQIAVRNRSHEYNGDIWRTLDRFLDDPNVEKLKVLRLKSLRISTEVESDLVFSTNSDSTAVVAWQKRLENRLGGAVAVTGVSADDNVPIDS
jgi:hypothetical protein